MSARIAGVAIAAGLLLSACATPGEQREADMAVLEALLPGHYDAANGMSLSIQRANAPFLGFHVFYIRERAAGAGERILRQELWSLSVVGKDIVQTIWVFKEPQRWNELASTPELFRIMLPADVKPRSGCEFTWKKDALHFSASNDARKCGSEERVDVNGDILTLVNAEVPVAVPFQRHGGG